MKLTCWVCPRTWATWSYSLHPAGLLLWQDRELRRIQKVVRGFLFYRPTAVLNQGCDLLTSLIHASRITSCVSSTIGTDSQMYHKSTGHIPAKLNCSFSSRTEKHLTSDCLFFYLTGTLAGSQMEVLVRAPQRGGTQRRWSDSSAAAVHGGTAAVLRVQKQTLDCSSSLFSLFPPSCRDVQEPWQSFVRRYLGFGFLEKHLQPTDPESLWCCCYFLKCKVIHMCKDRWTSSFAF